MLRAVMRSACDCAAFIASPSGATTLSGARSRSSSHTVRTRARTRGDLRRAFLSLTRADRLPPARSATCQPRLFRYRALPNSRADENAAYALSPVGSDSQRVLRSPRKAPRKISTVPYKVLDAPALQVCWRARPHALRAGRRLSRPPCSARLSAPTPDVSARGSARLPAHAPAHARPLLPPLALARVALRARSAHPRARRTTFTSTSSSGRRRSLNVLAVGLGTCD